MPPRKRNADELPDDSQPKAHLLSPVVINTIALVVTVVWSASFVADILIMSYSPPSAIHVAFMVILGGIFGVQIVQGKK